MCWEPNQTELSLQLLFIAGVIFSIIGNLCFNLMNLYLSINSSFFVSMLPVLILLISKSVIRCSRSPHYGFLNSYQPLRHWWSSTQCFFLNIQYRRTFYVIHIARQKIGFKFDIYSKLNLQILQILPNDFFCCNGNCHKKYLAQ